MTTQEFSNQFDTLTNSYYNKPEFGNVDHIAFDEYEKSVFLTDAQEEIVLELYSGKNSFGDSFEKTEEVRRFISNLIVTYETEEKLSNYKGVSKNSIFFSIPENVLFITYESVVFEDERLGCMNKEEGIVVPVTQDDFYKIQKNPFRGPGKNRVLRLDNSNNIIEVITDYNIVSYLVRYLRKPNPIILDNFSEEVSINGKSNITECELNPIIHNIILDRAVRKAIASRSLISNIKE